MAHVFVACPQCGAGYKIEKGHLATPAVCRSCGHRWVPAEVRAAREQGDVPPTPPKPSDGKGRGAPAGGGSPADALASLAAAREQKGGNPPPKTAPPKTEKTPEPKAAEPKPPSGKKAAKPDADALLGRQVNGFKIQSRIGTGVFGIVYRAFDTNLERSVAIKMLPANLAKAGRSVVERFLREARSAAKLAHPNIVTIHQICPYKNTYYIVMELVDDGALHEVLAKNQRLRPEEATRIVRAAAEGLAHAHKRGIIHRDIKPGNIMLTSDGQVKVSDFGLARDVLQSHDIIGAGHSLGTPRYMAPEQALGEEPSAASDLYSLAATYYVLLTGRPAFDGTGDRAIMKQQVQAPVPDPRQYRPSLPPAVFRFFEKAMAKEPADRYAVAEDFIAALDRLDFSKAADDLSDSQDLADQLGSVTAEGRASHLSETLGRAVRRARRQRTPMSEDAIDDVLGAGTATGREAGWKLWLLIGALVLLLVIGAVVAAILLAPGEGETAKPKDAKKAGATPSGRTPPPETPPETPTEGAAPTTPAEPPEETPTEAPTPSRLEDVAQEVLQEVRAYESDPETPIYELIRMYRENVLQVYPGTKAADEARQALERLEKGKRLPEGAAAEEPSAEEKPPEEAPAEEAPSEAEPAA